MQSKVGGKPGEETALTDERFHNWAHSCLTDGRILVNSAHPTLGWGVFLLTRRDDGIRIKGLQPGLRNTKLAGPPRGSVLPSTRISTSTLTVWPT